MFSFFFFFFFLIIGKETFRDVGERTEWVCVVVVVVVVLLSFAVRESSFFIRR